ncbi:Sugar (and other) transporter [Phytophthora infestans]|uniref:Sugar (And other) transporter n=1 Tax=Phytophthora infestans TaxID=4787 RepID=A0A8S9UNI6_PHYIN|nr:Sugar (and other) transporter [Phytophthora infestans]
MTEVVKLFPYLNINGVFFMFAGLALLCGLFIYFYCPETKGILLEDIETLFSRSNHTAMSPSYGAVKTPVAATDKSPVAQWPKIFKTCQSIYYNCEFVVMRKNLLL